MKKFLKVLLLSACILITKKGVSQITYFGSIPNGVQLCKFSIGYKYVNVNVPGLTITFYNLNQTVYKTLALPSHPSFANYVVSYVTDKLFDLDTTIEYAVTLSNSSPTSNQTYIYDESGTVLLFKDSAALWQSTYVPAALKNGDCIYFDGFATRMKLIYYPTATSTSAILYTLPGGLPCTECSQGVISGIAEGGGDSQQEAQFYPNPSSNHLKLLYKLPPGAKKAYIKVYDMTGKLVQDMEITNDFDSILLPANYNNGLYLYSLVVDGTLIKNEKIVLIK